MGQFSIRPLKGPDDTRRFQLAVLRDLDALERMLRSGVFLDEEGVFGVEQEMFLVEDRPPHRPAPVARELLAAAQDPRLTTELALFNLEANLPPGRLGGRFLSGLEQELNRLIAELNAVAAEHRARVSLTGILPTLRHRDFTPLSMTPELRYEELDRAMKKLRGGDNQIFIRGLDQLEIRAASVILEAANCSLQLHYQVSPEAFPSRYNFAQLISAPLLAAASNSPVLLGQRLWHETRVALFESTADSRSHGELRRSAPPRVFFGDDWVHESALELFRHAALRYRALLGCVQDVDSIALLEQGTLPSLPALSLHNGTIWRWNRACFGVQRNEAHLRIENRVLPAGPTVIDEVANAALYYGLMAAPEPADLAADKRIRFIKVKENFLSAARNGINANLHWLGGRTVQARELLLHELIPQARFGLESIGTEEADIDRYLGVLTDRLTTGRTGSVWILDSLAGKPSSRRQASVARVNTVMIVHQAEGKPVHTWPLADTTAPETSEHATVRSLMSEDLFTVRAEDPAELVTRLMRWQNVRHVPVEDESGRLVGIVSVHSLLFLHDEEGRFRPGSTVADIMDSTPPEVDPETTIDEAARALLATEHRCLLVTSENELVGIVTDRDLLAGSNDENLEPTSTPPDETPSP